MSENFGKNAGHWPTFPAPSAEQRPELRPDIRSAAFKGYVIFFRYVDEGFEVVNIIEGHRDIDEVFSSVDANE